MSISLQICLFWVVTPRVFIGLETLFVKSLALFLSSVIPFFFSCDVLQSSHLFILYFSSSHDNRFLGLITAVLSNFALN